MKIRNIHERTIAATREQIAQLLADFGLASRARVGDLCERLPASSPVCRKECPWVAPFTRVKALRKDSHRATPEMKSHSYATKIILVDGEKLIDLMLRHNIGVRVVERYDIKEIDQNYFDEGE